MKQAVYDNISASKQSTTCRRKISYGPPIIFMKSQSILYWHTYVYTLNVFHLKDKRKYTSAWLLKMNGAGWNVWKQEAWKWNKIERKCRKLLTILDCKTNNVLACRQPCTPESTLNWCHQRKQVATVSVRPNQRGHIFQEEAQCRKLCHWWGG